MQSRSDRGDNDSSSSNNDTVAGAEGAWSASRRWLLRAATRAGCPGQACLTVEAPSVSGLQHHSTHAASTARVPKTDRGPRCRLSAPVAPWHDERDEMGKTATRALRRLAMRNSTCDERNETTAGAVSSSTREDTTRHDRARACRGGETSGVRARRFRADPVPFLSPMPPTHWPRCRLCLPEHDPFRDPK